LNSLTCPCYKNEDRGRGRKKEALGEKRRGDFFFFLIKGDEDIRKMLGL
jgi:hypothetical protein